MNNNLESNDIFHEKAQGAPTKPSDASLQEQVSQKLNHYFSQLDNQEPSRMYELVLEQVELPLLEKMIEVTDNNQSKSATMLGLSRGTLRKKLKQYDLLGKV